jgi:transposase-like protein
VSETLTYYAFPDIHWQKIRTNNPLERIMRETREDNCLAICPTLASSRVEQRKQLALKPCEEASKYSSR